VNSAVQRVRSSPDREARADRDPPTRTAHAPSNPVLAARGLALDGLGNRALLSLLRSGRLQRQARTGPADPPDGPATAPAADVLGHLSSGRHLDEGTRSLMESRFGESFDDVRIHTGHHAAEAADTLQARAFTVGEDIVFGAEEFAPETTEGRRLLAHELTHVLQQRRSTGSPASGVATEAEADAAAHDVVQGGPVRVATRAVPGEVQRQSAEEHGFARPTSHVRGMTVLVNGRPMVYFSGAERLEKEGSTWDPAKRVYGVSLSALGRFAWRKSSNAEADARRDNLVVVLTARSRFSGATRTLTIGSRGPAKPPPSGPPAPPPATDQEPPAEEPAATRAPSSDRVTQVERQSRTNPEGALPEASELSPRELASLGPQPRQSLLHAAAHAPAGSAAPHLARDLITTTPDRDAGAVAEALQADGGRLLADLKRSQSDAIAAADLDDAARDLDRRRQDTPATPHGSDFIDWTPELAQKANEVRDAIRNLGRRPLGLHANLADRPEWTGVKARQQADLERELRNLERDVSRWDAEQGPLAALRGDSAATIGATAREEVARALEGVHAATTITELFEARKRARHALWRANQMMDAKRGLDQLESAVQAWNRTQSGWAEFASRPSHALAGATFDRPDRIAAETRAEIQRGLERLREAQTPEEMSRAATHLKQTLANANLALSDHQDQVYGGGEHLIVGIKVVAVTSAAVVAPQYVIPGFVLGGGLDAARQGVQIAEGSRQEFSGMETFDSAVTGGFIAPFAVGIPGAAYGLTGLGLLNAGGEFAEGHALTGTFDLATAALPFAVKGLSGSRPNVLNTQWVRTRTGALMLRVSVAVEEVPALGGRNPTPSLPLESPAGLVVNARGQPISLLGSEIPVAPPQGHTSVAPASPGRVVTAPARGTVARPIGRTAGPEIWGELRTELGLEVPTGGQRTGSAVDDARAAGFVHGWNTPGSADLAVQPHRSASAVRGAYGITGSDAQSAHNAPTSFLRSEPGYSRGAAQTVLLDPATHRAFDAYWKTWAQNQRRAGQTHCRAHELYGVMLEAIDQIPGLQQRTKNAMAWQLHLEMFGDLGLRWNQDIPLPYANVPPASSR
jgi:hypothetical protein